LTNNTPWPRRPATLASQLEDGPTVQLSTEALRGEIQETSGHRLRADLDASLRRRAAHGRAERMARRARRAARRRAVQVANVLQICTVLSMVGLVLPTAAYARDEHTVGVQPWPVWLVLAGWAVAVGLGALGLWVARHRPSHSRRNMQG
jgi:hypothetical protein